MFRTRKCRMRSYRRLPSRHRRRRRKRSLPNRIEKVKLEEQAKVAMQNEKSKLEEEVKVATQKKKARELEQVKVATQKKKANLELGANIAMQKKKVRELEQVKVVMENKKAREEDEVNLARKVSEEEDSKANHDGISTQHELDSSSTESSNGGSESAFSPDQSGDEYPGK
jgi:hypothetical protein